jgi:hypothetical protein
MTNTFARNTLVLTCTVLLFVAAAAPALARIVRTDRVERFSTDTWRVWAAAGETRVMVNGDGDTDLDCSVYDRFGNLLGSDTDDTDLCIVDFDNPTSGNLTIRIQNLGGVYNRYVLTVE